MWNKPREYVDRYGQMPPDKSCNSDTSKIPAIVGKSAKFCGFRENFTEEMSAYFALPCRIFVFNSARNNHLSLIIGSIDERCRSLTAIYRCSQETEKEQNGDVTADQPTTRW